MGNYAPSLVFDHVRLQSAFTAALYCADSSQPLSSFAPDAARTDAELRAAALIYNEARVKLRGNEMEIRVR